jgi:predicted homoserine dehydrogenase-like protein
MIIVDTQLKARAAQNKPVLIGLFGSGFMGRGLVAQVRHLPGLEVGLICNRRIETARNAYLNAGVPAEIIVETDDVNAMERALAAGKRVVTSNYKAACAAPQLDVLIEATGHVEYGAHVTMEAIANRKHMVLMNAELDGTIGPLLKTYADKTGTILTGCDGDQPGVQINLYRFVESIGLRPLLCGNIKGLQDRFRNPTTQEGYARTWGQTPHMVTSFADGTKISFEQAIVANATGMQVAKRGMIGLEYNGHVDEMVGMYDVDQLRELGGIVDYVVGAQPSPGIYLFAEARDDVQALYLNLGKLGKGPLYSFYIPYHLTILETPISAARVALCGDAVVTPLGAPRVDVVTAAKIELKAGQRIDGLGGYMTYGTTDNYAVSRRENLLPMGLAEDCTLTRDIPVDQVLTYDDVELPKNRLAVELRAKQDAIFPA